MTFFRPLVVVPIMVMGALAGCIGDPGGTPILDAHRTEWAVYRAMADGVTADVQVSYTWGEEVVVHMAAAYEARQFEATTWHNRSTGELLRSWEPLRGEQFGVSNDGLDNEGTEYPFGVHRILPAKTWLSPDPDMEAPWALAPFGPQLAVLWKEGSFAWGEAWVTVDHGATWNVRAQGACQHECHADTQEDVTWTMEGEWTNLLPLQAVLDRPGDLRDVRLERIDHGAAGRVSLAVAPPAPPVTGPRAACGLAPCEPQGWPARRSLQFGLTALEASPLWQQWADTQTGIAPFLLHAPSCGTALTVETTCQWTFQFAARPGPGVHAILRAPVVTGQPVQPILLSLRPDPGIPPPSTHAFPREQVFLDRLLNATDHPPTSWMYMQTPNAEFFPDVRGAYTLSIGLEAPDGYLASALVSAETGQLLRTGINRMIQWT